MLDPWFTIIISYISYLQLVLDGSGGAYRGEALIRENTVFAILILYSKIILFKCRIHVVGKVDLMLEHKFNINMIPHQ